MFQKLQLLILKIQNKLTSKTLNLKPLFIQSKVKMTMKLNKEISHI